MYWVRLDRLARGADAGAIEDEIARAVVGADFSGRSAREAIADTLRAAAGPGRALPAVLVLDSCEHVLDSAAAVTAELLEALGELTVVATSRTPLGWFDEYLVPVAPLSRQQAVALFRGRAVDAGRPVDDSAQLPIVEEICRRLHDHPLYIRLAAARLSRRTLSAILDELSGGPGDGRLDWTSGPDSAADPRHSGIGAVIAWSVDLCEARERLLFERMSVFAAGHEHEPVERRRAGRRSRTGGDRGGLCRRYELRSRP